MTSNSGPAFENWRKKIILAIPLDHPSPGCRHKDHKKKVQDFKMHNSTTVMDKMDCLLSFALHLGYMQWLYRCLHHSSLPWRTRQISRCGWKNGAENFPPDKHFVLENTKLYGDPQIKIWSDNAETLNPDRKDWFLARQITEAGLVEFFLILSIIKFSVG